MVNRYTGELRINPVAVLRNDDFNNRGEIADVDMMLAEAVAVQTKLLERVVKLRIYLESRKGTEKPVFRFAEGGYIAIEGLSDRELVTMKSNDLVDLFDNATDRDWVKKYGYQFGLTWEDGRAVEI